MECLLWVERGITEPHELTAIPPELIALSRRLLHLGLAEVIAGEFFDPVPGWKADVTWTTFVRRQ